MFSNFVLKSVGSFGNFPSVRYLAIFCVLKYNCQKLRDRATTKTLGINRLRTEIKNQNLDLSSCLLRSYQMWYALGQKEHGREQIRITVSSQA